MIWLAAAAAVTASNFSFAPATLTVKPGDTVTWTNAGGLHNVKFPDAAAMPPDPSTPENFNAAGVTRTFTEPGTYKYYCVIHAQDENDANGMVGTIVVSDGVIEEPVDLPFNATVKGLKLIVRSSQKVEVEAVVTRKGREVSTFGFKTKDGRKVVPLRVAAGDPKPGRYKLRLTTEGYPGTAKLTFTVPKP